MKKSVFIFLFFAAMFCKGQTDSIKPQKKDSVKPYNRKEEIVYDGKRYRKYNNYLTFGAGPLFSSIRAKDQKNIGGDFQFHIKTQYFQIGAFMSGDDFLNNKYTNGHLGIGLRHERNKFNLAAFVGPAFSVYVTELRDTSGAIIDYPVSTAIGGYISLQAVYKIKYDVGIGGEIFADLSDKQQAIGARLIIYFSGAYRGIKRGFKTKKQ